MLRVSVCFSYVAFKVLTLQEPAVEMSIITTVELDHTVNTELNHTVNTVWRFT